MIFCMNIISIFVLTIWTWTHRAYGLPITEVLELLHKNIFRHSCIIYRLHFVAPIYISISYAYSCDHIMHVI